MINRAIVICSIVCISLLSFNTLNPSKPDITSQPPPNEIASNFQKSSIKQVEQTAAPDVNAITCPSSGGVILYRNANFDCAGLGEGVGYVLQATTGWQNLPAIFQNQASSIRIPSGWSVKLYEFTNRTGASVCRSADDSTFAGDYFDGGVVELNDRVDSIEVFGYTSCGGPPSAPTLIFPANGSSVESTTGLSLDWASSSGAAQYYSHLWGGPGIDINSGWITNTDWMIGTLGAGTYSWQVKARNTFGESTWSETWNLIVTGPRVRITRIWTGDGNWNPKTTFDPGDPIQWVIDIENLTDSLATIDVIYDVELDNGDTIIYWHGPVTTSPGIISWGLPGTLPENRGGTHSFAGSVKFNGGETIDSADYTLTGPYVDFIFSDGFENGNLLKWTARKTDSGDLAVTLNAALKGERGMRALIDDNNSIYVKDASPYRDSKYRARFYFDPNSIAMENLDDHRIFVGYDHTEELTSVLRIEFRRAENAYQMRAGARNDILSTWTNTNWFTIGDESHYLEVAWQAASSPGANDGVLNLWIDGEMRANRVNIDNDTFHIDEINLGAVAGLDSGTRGTYYFDAFKSTHTTRIGSALAESINEPVNHIENVIGGPPVSK